MRMSEQQQIAVDTILSATPAIEVERWVTTGDIPHDLTGEQQQRLSQSLHAALSLDIMDWLGDGEYGGLTVPQIQELAGQFDAIYTEYCTPQGGEDRVELEQDTEQTREELYTLAYRLMVEDPATVVREIGADLLRARATEADARTKLKAAARHLITEPSQGNRGITSIAGFADTAGLSRQAVTGWVAP